MPKPTPQELTYMALCVITELDEVARRGTDNSKAKLTEEIIRAARAEWIAGDTLDTLAARYSVCRLSLYCAFTGKSWKHIYEPLPPMARRSGMRRATEVSTVD